MGGSWHVTAWGVRGSYPVPEAAFLDYGGNTSCFSVDCGTALAVFDAGSGLAGLGEWMVRPDGPRRADIFLSHLHLDHVQGLVSFRPLFFPSREIHLYGRPGLRAALDKLLSPPWWPVGLGDFPAEVHIHELGPGGMASLPSGASAEAIEGRHPNGCLYYRLEGGGRRMVYALDCEPDGETAQRLADFAQGADLLVWDANFVEADFKPGWGHSTWRQGAEIARAAGVKRVLMAHYAADHNDAFLCGQEALAREAAPNIYFAKEGMVMEL